MIHENIKEQVKQAMKDKDAVKLTTMRSLVAAFTNELVAKKRKPDERLADDEALAVIKRAVKQRKDSIEQFTAGGRQDLVESEQAELAILETFLPQQMSEAEIMPIAEKKKAELGLASKADSLNPNRSGDAGKLMSALMKELAGRADGATVKAVVEKILS